MTMGSKLPELVFKESGRPPPPIDLASVGPFGDYRVVAHLGRGGMADVFLAVDDDGPGGVDEAVVIKRLHRDDVTEAMFLDEARLAARLKHPNVALTYEGGLSPSGFYAVSEFVYGPPLNLLMSRAQKASYKLPTSFIVYVASEALRGLHYAHELCEAQGRLLNFVHGDVAPDNIFLTYEGEVKLVDFGVARAAWHSMLVASGRITGRARYTAPERARGASDRRSDLYAMGAVLWELATGTWLFGGDDSQAMVHSLLDAPIPSVHSVRPEVDPALEAVIARALAKDPKARYSTAEEMRKALLACCPDATETGAEALRKALDELFAEAREGSRQSLKARLTRQARAGGSSAPPPPVGSSTPPPPLVRRSITPPAGRPALPPVENASPLESSESRLRAADSTDGVFRGAGSLAPPDIELEWAKANASGSRRARSVAIVVGAVGVAAAAAFVGRGVARTQTPEVTATVTTASTTEAATVATAASSAPEHARKIAVAIETAPPGASVKLDGKSIGTSPVRVEVERARHAVALSKEGFQPEELSVDAARDTDDAITFHVRLVPRPEQGRGATRSPRRPIR